MLVREEEPGRLVTLQGRLGAANVADVRDALHRAVDAGVGDLVVDVEALELLDATALGMLMGVHRRARRAERRLVLRSVPERMDRLLRVTRLHRVIHVDVDVAVG